jgi:hypothetical protein
MLFDIVWCFDLIIKEEDKEVFAKAIDVAAKAAVEFAKSEKIQNIMQKYNGKAE